MPTLQQIEALQKQLAEEIACAEFLQSDPLLAEVLPVYKNRIHQMFNKPLYGCVAWVSFDVTPEFISNVLPELFKKHITTLSGSGFWRYTSVPNLPESVASILAKDNKAEFRRNTEASAETSNTGTKVSFYILVQGKPVRIDLNFSYQSKAFKVPYLTENYRYTKDGRNGKKYIGVNGAPSSDNCIGVYSFGALSALLPELSQ